MVRSKFPELANCCTVAYGMSAFMNIQCISAVHDLHFSVLLFIVLPSFLKIYFYKKFIVIFAV